MEKLFEKIEEPLMKIGDKVNNIAFFQVLRDSFMLAFPLIIFGSIITIIANFPFLADIIGKDNANHFKEILSPASDATMNIMALFVCIGIGYYFSKNKKCEGVFGAAVCVCAFFILLPMITGNTYAVDEAGQSTDVLLAEESTQITIWQLGAKGMFVAIFASFLAAWLYCFFTSKNLQIKMPETVPPAVSKSFAALIPASLTLAIFLIIRIVFTFTPWNDVFTFVYTFVQTPLVALGSGLGATIVAIFFVQFFWFFGLHGQIIVNSVLDPIWNTLMIENMSAFNNGDILPNIVTKPFMEVFTVGLGGSGATLIVVLMLVFFVRSKQLKNLGKLALPPGIFNVNEPFIFGLPIIFNPLVIIPWIIAPIVSVTVAFLAMQLGLVPYTTGVAVPWTVPIFISGMLATNSWQGAVLQLVQVAIVGIIWFPFIKVLDKRMFKQETKDAKAIKEKEENTETTEKSNNAA